jgi:hypothetical protein
MIHAVRGFDRVWASATIVATVGWAASLVVLIESLIRGLGFLFCRGDAKNFSQFSSSPQPSESILCTRLG